MSEGFLASLLRVERAGESAFSARLHDYDGVAFGGDALGKATHAAAQTCQGKALHALHAAFLRPLPRGETVELRVATLSDGRRVARRRVDVCQGQRLLCQVTASFAIEVEGARWQEARAPEVARPESLPLDTEEAKRYGWERWDPDREEFEWRFVDPVERRSLASGMRSAWCVWLRPRQPLPADPGLHAAALAYVSDLLSQWSACRRLGRDVVPGEFASLDHSLHVHRPGRWDDWWLCCDRSEVAHGGRAAWRREIFASDGALVASVAQDAWIAAPEQSRS